MPAYSLSRIDDGEMAPDIAPPSARAERRMITESAPMRALYALASRAAVSNANVLILGETGVGKEVLAEAIHRGSPRASRPFLALNCAAFTESLVDAELFGYERGAFTGAAQTKAGLLEAAVGGTVFLDEIGEMPLPMQAKLLRAIESRQILRLGALKTRPIDARFIAATNCDVAAQVAEKSFRADLFFRLNVICLEIPPLRARPEEIEPLARLFLEELTPAGAFVPVLASETLALMRAYPWPGNVRELRNAMERALVYCLGATIAPEHLGIQDTMSPAAAPPAGTLRGRLDRDAIVDALWHCQGNQTRAARLLGISRGTLCNRLNAYHLPRPRPRPAGDASLVSSADGATKRE